MNIGFIGFGEASSNIAQGLLKAKECHVYAYDNNYQQAQKVREAMEDKDRIKLLDSVNSLLKEVDNIFVAIPGKFDKSLMCSILPPPILLSVDNLQFVKGKLFIDLCTAKPEDKFEISELVKKSGNYYVDVAVMGSVPSLKHKVPMYVSGPGCELMVDALSSFDMDITVVGKKAGCASIIKLCRSIYMKGIAALSIELEKVCDHYGVKDEVYASLAKSMDNDAFMIYTPRLIKGTIKHCSRRLNEVKECIELIEAAEIEGYMTKATAKLYEDILKQ